MLVLDLDLDFFVSPIGYLQNNPGQRLSDEEHAPWRSSEVRDFLEGRCRLSNNVPSRGRIVERHGEALSVWAELLSRGELCAPFDVVHVDAHADLGMGDAGWFYVFTQTLTLPVDERPKPPADKVTQGNYLLFALAFRWIKSLTFVTHPEWRNDLFPYALKDFDLSSGYLQLKSYRTEDAERLFPGSEKDVPVLTLEPEVPFRRVACGEYLANEPPDYLLVSRSPEYTPPLADGLLDAIREYMVLV